MEPTPNVVRSSKFKQRFRLVSVLPSSGFFLVRALTRRFSKLVSEFERANALMLRRWHASLLRTKIDCELLVVVGIVVVDEVDEVLNADPTEPR